MGIVNNNPFLNVIIEDFSGETHLSKDLYMELYQVYKAADGVNVQFPSLVIKDPINWTILQVD